MYVKCFSLLILYSRCLEYSINVRHTGHVPVKANVIQLTLSLSTTQLTLTAPSITSKAVGECINDSV